MGMLLRGGRCKADKDMRRPVVLIVDDEEPIRKTLTLLLADHYEAIGVPDAMQAIDVVRSKGVDIVLMDINLPEMDGIAGLEWVSE